MMLYNFKKIIWVAALILIMPYLSFGQTALCTQNLNEAGVLYEEGKLVDVINKINQQGCLESGFTKEQKTRAYRLLALVNIFLDDERGAEDAIINLLVVDPEHPLNENDPIELVYLYQKYRSKPIFRIGVFAGPNYAMVNSLERYGAFSFNSEEPPVIDGELVPGGGRTIEKVFSPGVGIHIGATVEAMPVKNIEVILRGELSWQNYDVSNQLITDFEQLEVYDFQVKDLKESQLWANIPIAVRLNLPLKKMTPYVIGGASFNYLLSAEMNGSREGTTTKSANVNLNDFDMRQKVNGSYFAGVGLKLNIKRTSSVFLEATYNIGGRNIVNGQNRYASQKLNYDIAHVDDDKSINSIKLSIGWILSIYNPKRYSDKKLIRIAEKLQKKERNG